VVAPVHGEDVVEVVEILGPGLAAAQVRQVDAPAPGGVPGAVVRRRVDVPAAGAGGIGFDDGVQALPADQLAEYALGRGRAADVAKADEQNVDQGAALSLIVRR
tara:strand:- start:2639 stop:2950 length:312 start_codon:yes stop_codon:yes gene_type:complete